MGFHLRLAAFRDSVLLPESLSQPAIKRKFARTEQQQCQIAQQIEKSMLPVFKWLTAVYIKYNDQHADDQRDEGKSGAQTNQNEQGTNQLRKNGKRIRYLASHVERIGPIGAAFFVIQKLGPAVQGHQSQGHTEQKDAQVDRPGA